MKNVTGIHNGGEFIVKNLRYSNPHFYILNAHHNDQSGYKNIVLDKKTNTISHDKSSPDSAKFNPTINIKHFTPNLRKGVLESEKKVKWLQNEGDIFLSSPLPINIDHISNKTAAKLLIHTPAAIQSKLKTIYNAKDASIYLPNRQTLLFHNDGIILHH